MRLISKAAGLIMFGLDATRRESASVLNSATSRYCVVSPYKRGVTGEAWKVALPGIGDGDIARQSPGAVEHQPTIRRLHDCHGGILHRDGRKARNITGIYAADGITLGFLHDRCPDAGASDPSESAAAPSKTIAAFFTCSISDLHHRASDPDRS